MRRPLHQGARRRGPHGRGRTSFGKVVLKANGGGSPLGSAVFSLPPGLGLRTVDDGKRIGSIELFGFNKRRTIPIEAGDGIVAGGKVKLEGLPSKVRRLRVSLVLAEPAGRDRLLRHQAVEGDARRPGRQLRQDVGER